MLSRFLKLPDPVIGYDHNQNDQSQSDNDGHYRVHIFSKHGYYAAFVVAGKIRMRPTV